jgi:hypothetical protein
MLGASAWPMFGALRRTQERLCRVTAFSSEVSLFCCLGVESAGPRLLVLWPGAGLDGCPVSPETGTRPVRVCMQIAMLSPRFEKHGWLTVYR